MRRNEIEERNVCILLIFVTEEEELISTILLSIVR